MKVNFLQVCTEAQGAHRERGREQAAHAGFPGTSIIDGLARDCSLSPLHFEVYEFARRAAPSSTHLQEVHRLLDRVRASHARKLAT